MLPGSNMNSWNNCVQRKTKIMSTHVCWSTVQSEVMQHKFILKSSSISNKMRSLYPSMYLITNKLFFNWKIQLEYTQLVIRSSFLKMFNNMGKGKCQFDHKTLKYFTLIVYMMVLKFACLNRHKNKKVRNHKSEKDWDRCYAP